MAQVRSFFELQDTMGIIFWPWGG